MNNNLTLFIITPKTGNVTSYKTRDDGEYIGDGTLLRNPRTVCGVVHAEILFGTGAGSSQPDSALVRSMPVPAAGPGLDQQGGELLLRNHAHPHAAGLGVSAETCHSEEFELRTGRHVVFW